MELSDLRTLGSTLRHKLGHRVRSGDHRHSGPPGTETSTGHWAVARKKETRLFPAEATLPMPPPSLQNQVGPPGVFHDVALTTMGRLNLAGLRPDHDVLDIGCGVGRTARYLCDYLDESSRYEGFDITRELVQWCQRNITPAFSNFHFQHIPLFNSAYQPRADLPSPAELRFPYPDASFDFVLAHSVFTHLDLDASLRYLEEIHRVLRPSGVSYTTWLLFEDDPARSVNPLIAGMVLDPSGRFAVDDVNNPDTAIGFSEQFVRDAHRRHSLEIVEPIRFGFGKLQDAVVATRSTAS
jgi:SAM-dependent methyltransferase